MDLKSKLEEFRVAVEEERKNLHMLISKAKSELEVGQRVEALVDLDFELRMEQLLMGQLEERIHRVQEIKSRFPREIIGAVVTDVTPPAQQKLHQHALQLVFKYLGEADLLNCRLVNKEWNSEVVAFITNIPDYSYYNKCGEYISFYSIWNCNLTSLGCNRLRKFHLLLKGSKEPGLFMKNVNISQDRENVSSLNAECEFILQQFGQYVQNLNVEDNGEFPILSRCLGRNGLTPNLTELTVNIYERCYEVPYCFVHPFVNELGELPVKKLSFSYAKEAVSTRKSLAAMLTVFSGIVQNSSGIEYLEIDNTGFSTPRDWKTRRFLQKLQWVPEVMRNLKEFKVTGHLLDSFGILSRIQFGPNLTRVKLIDEGPPDEESNEEDEESDEDDEESEEDDEESEEDDEEEPLKNQRNGLRQFLKKISNSVESLSLISCDSKFKFDSRQAIPSMPKLKKFKLHGISIKEFDFDCFLFLKNCPALKEFSLCFQGEETYHQLLQHCWTSSSTSKNGEPKLVHECVEEVGLESSEVETPATIQILNGVFPNLTTLKITPKIEAGRWVEGHQWWFQKCFRYISKMESLKELTIHFGEWNCNGLKVDLTQAFLKLKETPNLVKLWIFGLKEEEFKTDSIASSLLALVGAPKLRTISFFCFPVKDQNLEARIKEMVKDFAKSNICLEAKHN